MGKDISGLTSPFKLEILQKNTFNLQLRSSNLDKIKKAPHIVLLFCSQVYLHLNRGGSEGKDIYQSAGIDVSFQTEDIP